MQLNLCLEWSSFISEKKIKEGGPKHVHFQILIFRWFQNMVQNKIKKLLRNFFTVQNSIYIFHFILIINLIFFLQLNWDILKEDVWTKLPRGS